MAVELAIFVHKLRNELCSLVVRATEGLVVKPSGLPVNTEGERGNLQLREHSKAEC